MFGESPYIATTFTPEGKRTSINVECVGNLMMRHYIEDIAERSHCRLVSQSDSIGPHIVGRVKIVVIWTCTADPVDAGTTRFTTASKSPRLPATLKSWRSAACPSPWRARAHSKH